MTIFKCTPISIDILDENDRRRKPAYLEVSPVHIDGHSANRMMVVLRTPGCVYGNTSAACAMCGFKLHSDNAITDDDLQKQVDFAFMVIYEYPQRIEQVDLLTLGSFYDDREITPSFREYSLSKISRLKFVSKVVVESRASHITKEKLDKTKSLLSDKKVEVGVGVESSNEQIRNNILRKGLGWSTLERAVSIIGEAGMSFQPYLLIKPPGLSEKDAILDAIQSAKDMVKLAEKYNVELRVAFEPVFVPQNTELEELYLSNKYKLLNIWSIIEVIRGVHGLSTIFIGMSDENLSLNRVPTSCEKCSTRLRDSIYQYNALQDLSVLDVVCDCRVLWMQDINTNYSNE